MDVKRSSTPVQARTHFYFYNDFVNNITSPYLQVSGSGTGNSATTLATPVDASCVGVTVFNQGTDTSGRSGVTSANQACIVFDAIGIWTCETRVYLPTLSTGTDRFKIMTGFMDVLPSSGLDSVDGAYFSYTDSLNSGKWELITTAASTRTRTDSGVTVANNTWYTLKTIVRSIGGVLTAQFYINDVKVASDVTTNIPTGTANATGYGSHNAKMAGTTNVPSYIDYIEVIGYIPGRR